MFRHSVIPPFRLIESPLEKPLKPLENPLTTRWLGRWILPFQGKTVSVRFRVRGHNYYMYSHIPFQSLDDQGNQRSDLY